MSKVQDILRDSLMLLGAIAPGEGLDGQDGQDCLRRLNAMLASWNTESLIVYSINRDVYPLTIGVQDYTMGPGGTLTTVRPVRIENASIIPIASQPNLEIPIHMLRDEEWRDISIKNVQSTFPTHVYPKGDFPANTLEFWPVPSQACSVVLYTWTQLGSFTDMNQDVSFPPGYEEAIVYNLAPRLAPMYGKQTPPEVVMIAQSSKGRLKAINLTVPVLTVDSALQYQGRGPSVQANQSRGYVVDP